MKTKRALEILNAVIGGVDPTTGEELPADGLWQRADVLRALLLAKTTLEEKSAREARRAFLPAKVGAPWDADEERTLTEAFRAGDALSDIATRLGRTVRAIEARLQRLGLITPDQRSTQDSFG